MNEKQKTCSHKWFCNDRGNAECFNCELECEFATEMLEALGIDCASTPEPSGE